MIDIVTVVFQDELDVLQVQAESIEKYLDNLGIKNIFVMVNDSMDIIQQIDPIWWGSLADRVKIIPREQFPVEYTGSGWLTQQLLKILGSTLSTNQWSMILDAKTILIKPWNLDLIFDRDGKLINGIAPIQPVFAPAGELVSKLFNINLEHVAGPAGVPFMFNNRLIHDMIKEVESRTGQDFSRWFLQAGLVTEFILYTGYVQWRYGNLSKCYSNTSNGYQVTNICHSELANYDSKIKILTNGNNHSVSIHRNCWKNLATEQKKIYTDFLINQEIQKANLLCEH